MSDGAVQATALNSSHILVACHGSTSACTMACSCMHLAMLVHAHAQSDLLMHFMTCSCTLMTGPCGLRCVRMHMEIFN